MTGSGESSLRNVTVTGATEGIAVVETADPVMIEGVIVERVSELGLRIAEASEVEGSMLVVRDTLSGPSRAEGRGIRVLGGSMLKLSQGLVIDNHLVGLSVSGASRAELSGGHRSGNQGAGIESLFRTRHQCSRWWVFEA